MSILYIITQADGGGAQKYVLALAKHFKGSIAAGTEAPALFDAASSLQLTTYNLRHLRRSISPYHDLLAIFEIRSLIKKLNPDIVHLNSTKAGFLGSLASAGLKTKTVFTAHGFRFLEPLSPFSRFFYLLMEKLASYFRDFIITVSDIDRQAATEHNFLHREKIKTVYNGLPPLAFLARDEARSQLQLPQNLFAFCTVANFYKTKGLDVLIKAVSLLHPSILDKCKFVIIGDGPEIRNLELEIRNLRLENTVVLTGKINNAYQYLKAFDAFLLPSRKEGFPFVLLEAMQAGLPVIATDTGGVREALGDSGKIVTASNPFALSKAIGELIKNPDTMHQLSDKAVSRSKIFSGQRMLEETEKIYKKILE